MRKALRLTSAALLPIAAAAGNHGKPNVIFFLVDDYGCKCDGNAKGGVPDAFELYNLKEDIGEKNNVPDEIL